MNAALRRLAATVAASTAIAGGVFLASTPTAAAVPGCTTGFSGNSGWAWCDVNQLRGDSVYHVAVTCQTVTNTGTVRKVVFGNRVWPSDVKSALQTEARTKPLVKLAALSAYSTAKCAVGWVAVGAVREWTVL